MITTNSTEIYDKLCLLRTHGISKNPDLMTENHGGWYYQMLELGYNYRMPDMLCALGITQLKRADAGLKRRREIAAIYSETFKGHPRIKIQNPNLQEGHAFHLYIIKTNDRLELYNYLRSKNIFAQVHYIPVHTMPYYQNLGSKKGDFPEAESFYNECLSLPMYPSLTGEEQEYVMNTIIEFFNNK
jgi:dTDP-4-amino-4,6-dideoxygalactose transaminase